MSPASPATGARGAQVDVRLAQPVVDAMRDLDTEQAAAVARAIQRIGEEPGVPLRIKLPGSLRRNYLAMPTGDDQAPVVIYRKSSEPGDYLVTGLADQETYNQYQHAEQQGLLDDPAVQVLIAGLVALAIGYAISTLGAKGSPAG